MLARVPYQPEQVCAIPTGLCPPLSCQQHKWKRPHGILLPSCHKHSQPKVTLPWPPTHLTTLAGESSGTWLPLRLNTMQEPQVDHTQTPSICEGTKGSREHRAVCGSSRLHPHIGLPVNFGGLLFYPRDGPRSTEGRSLHQTLPHPFCEVGKALYCFPHYHHISCFHIGCTTQYNFPNAWNIPDMSNWSARP